MTSQTVTAEKFLEDVDDGFDRVVEKHEVLRVVRGEGRDVVVLSAEDWESIEETMYLSSIPGYVDSLKEAFAEPIEEATPLEELEW